MMRNSLVLLTRTLFVATIVLASIAFVVFLNWYDTGKFDTSGLIPIAISGFLFGIAALLFDEWQFKRRSFWSGSNVLNFVSIIVQSVVCLSLILAISTGVSAALDNFASGKGMGASIQLLLHIPALMLFYGIMMIPFGIVVGILNGVLLLLIHRLQLQALRNRTDS